MRAYKYNECVSFLLLFFLNLKILKRLQDGYNSCSFCHSHKILTYCQCIQVSRKQAWQTTAHCVRIYGRYEQLCCSSTDGATGVKQLSALAAPGEKMLLNQEGFLNSPSLQGKSKPRGQRSLWAAMEAICLVVMAQQVSPGCGGWGGGPGFSKHLTRQEKKIAPQAQYQECPPHTVTHSAHTSQQPVFTRIPPHVHTAVFALSFVREGCPSKRKCWSGEREKKMERTTMATIGALLTACFCLNVTGLRFFSPFS